MSNELENLRQMTRQHIEYLNQNFKGQGLSVQILNEWMKVSEQYLICTIETKAGFVDAPIEPTKKMLDCYVGMHTRNFIRQLYIDMVSAGQQEAQDS